MENLKFRIFIKAAPEVVYKTITDHTSFSEWTSVFDLTSHVEGSWQEGSLMRFMSRADNGALHGLISRVKHKIPYAKISLEHVGLVQDGIDVLDNDRANVVKGATESYFLRAYVNGTELEIVTDVFMELKAYFLEVWPRALGKLKALCEA